MTPETLAAAAKIPLELAQVWAEPLSQAMQAYGIWSVPRQAAFIGQLAHESAGFTRLEENLNYSAARLMEVWPNRFPTLALATEYEHNPEKLANFVYANRMGNGSPVTGDGWRYRGRGPIQLTGYDAYKDASYDLFQNDRLLVYPEHVSESPWVGATVSARFWYARKLNDLADAMDFEGITKKINGGLTGLDDRIARIDNAMEALA